MPGGAHGFCVLLRSRFFMRNTTLRCAIWVVAVATAVGGLSACRAKSKTDGAPAGSALAGSSAGPLGSPDAAPPAVLAPVDAGPLASGIPVPASRVEQAVNGRRLPPYDGPTGTVEGTIRVSGDRAPVDKVGIPANCGEALATYGKLFREGTGRTLADVLVAVTEYDGYVPAEGDARTVSIHGCAFEKRTIAVTYGQRLEVANRDAQGNYLPTLVGASMPAQMVALPHGDPVRLYPTVPGLYALTDGMKREWMVADVFVVKYATVDVTDLTGHFRISRVPAGKVKVSALSPAIQQQDEREVVVNAGETTRADFVLAYKADKEPKPAKVKGAGEPAAVH
jgi:hypothetical protein